MTKRQSRILMAAAVWTTYVWVSRLVIMAGQDESAGFKVVHAVLAVISLAFGAAVGRIGWQNRSARAEQRAEKAEATVR